MHLKGCLATCTCSTPWPAHMQSILWACVCRALVYPDPWVHQHGCVHHLGICEQLVRCIVEDLHCSTCAYIQGYIICPEIRSRDDRFSVQSSAELTLGLQKGSCNGIPGEIKGDVIGRALFANVLVLSFKGKHLWSIYIHVYKVSMMFLSLGKNNFSLLLS